jgi:hypothetical protein
MAPKKTTTKKQPTKVLTERPPKPDQGEKKEYRVRSKAGLLTYNNPKVGAMDPLKFLQGVRNELCVKYPDMEKSLCLEMASRMHMHVFIENDERLDCDISHFVTSLSGPADDFQPNRGKNLSQGHYYCQCVWKDSHVECIFDVKKNPCGDWLMNLWKATPCKLTKIEEALAAEKLLVPRFQQQIRAVHNQNEKIRIEKMMAERTEILMRKKEIFAPVTEVQQWLEQYEVVDFRYKFLVLCGKSMLYKTQFAMSLFKNPKVHEDKIDWDGYDWAKNDAIIFDDVSQPDHIWKFVRQNKVLFQASGVVSVNTSATNCFKRDICVAQKPIVICTNDKDLNEHESHVDWIKENCVWISVTKKFVLLNDYRPALEAPPIMDAVNLI